MFQRMDFRWLASVRWSLTLASKALLGSFLLQWKVVLQRLTHNKIMEVQLCSAEDPQWYKVFLENSFSHASATKKIREVTFYFPNCSIWISESSVDTTVKLKLIGKMVLYVISQGSLTPSKMGRRREFPR